MKSLKKNLPKQQVRSVARRIVSVVDVVIVFGIGVGIAVGLFMFGRNVIQVKDELLFAYQNPDMVKMIREVYSRDHQQADTDIKTLLTTGNVLALPQ